MLENIARGARFASLIGAGLLAAGFLRVGIGFLPLRDRAGLVVRHLVVHAAAVFEDHGRALPFASGISLTRPDLHVFVFGGDGDAFSIGGNHFNHTARKNIKLTYCVMDNWVYGLTKKQTSPTSPLGFKSKTDQWGAVDYPINPMKQAISAGATFVARTTATNPNHVLAMMEAAMDHDGFSFIECLSECVEFYEGAFDASNPRKGGVFNEVPKDHDLPGKSSPAIL